MNANTKAHRACPWRVHAIAPDFELLDVWRFKLGERSGDLDAFLACLWRAAGVLAESWLAKTRVRIGRILHWDDDQLTLPIPGCSETSVGARMVAADRSANRARPDAPSPVTGQTVKTVYVFADEALYAFSNHTIHGLLHVALIRSATGGTTASLAVYIKSRGAFSRIYMAAIRPFRYAFVYPALIREVEAGWQAGPNRK